MVVAEAVQIDLWRSVPGDPVLHRDDAVRLRRRLDDDLMPVPVVNGMRSPQALDDVSEDRPPPLRQMTAFWRNDVRPLRPRGVELRIRAEEGGQALPVMRVDEPEVARLEVSDFLRREETV